MALTIYGWSDDLVEVAGDVREEFDAADETATIVTSNGVVVRVFLDPADGIWRITALRGTDKVKIIPEEQSDEDNTEVAVIEDDVEWVVCGRQLAVATSFTGKVPPAQT